MPNKHPPCSLNIAVISTPTYSLAHPFHLQLYRRRRTINHVVEKVRLDYEIDVAPQPPLAIFFSFSSPPPPHPRHAHGVVILS